MRQREKKNQSKGRISLDQIDILELLDELGIDYRESGKNVGEGWIGTNCPFCGDQNAHLGIHRSSKSISCFRCGTTGTIINYLSEELGSYSKAIEIIRKSVPRELKSFDEIKENKQVLKVNLPKDATKKFNKYQADYLHERRFDCKKLTVKYDLYFCDPFTKGWNNRIIVPIKYRGKIVTFTSIDIYEDSNLRYKHLKDEESIISIKHCLYGMEQATQPVCCLVEGLFDKYRIGDGALCTFGTNITSEQKYLLTKNFTKTIICFDGDDAGRTASNKIANDISTFMDVEIANLPEGLDPDKLDKNDIQYLRNKIGKN